MKKVKFLVLDKEVLNKRLTSKRKNEIYRLIDTCSKIQDKHEYYKNSYFWDSPRNSSQRRSYEDNNTFDITFKSDYLVLDVVYSVNTSCSCKNIYISKELCINDTKYSLTKINSLLKDLTKLLDIKGVKNDNN